MSDVFHVTYLLTLEPGDSPEVHVRALQLEQSAELPGSVVTSLGMQHVTGSVTKQEQIGENRYRVTIAWPSGNHGGEITQFLNVLFGNISLKRGIAITEIRWEDAAGLFGGPAFGIEGIRRKWGVPERALACTALKPMGCTTARLADLAYRFALGGIDIIKDDHGLAGQPSAPFPERVRACVDALDRAAQKTGHRSRYFPNITTDPHRVTERYEQAAELGADGVLLIPLLTGPALMHNLARHVTELPIMAHPAFSGTFVADVLTNRAGERPHGFEPGLLYGGLMRALGADFTIYPNTSGRFSFREEECASINVHARRPDVPFASCFPTPGGGIQRDRMSVWLQLYGRDTTFLMGGSLFEDPSGIEAASRAFMETLGA